MNRAALEEPTIPARLRRPLAAVWISIGVHAALIALIQVAPPSAQRPGASVIEARLVDVERPPALETSGAPSEPTPSEPAPTVPEPPRERTPVAAAKPLPPRQDESTAPLPPADAPVTMESPPPAAPPAGTPAPAPAGAAEPRAPVAPLDVTSAVDLTYYSARELDVQPRALREIVPDYPPNADRRRISGTVRLQIEIEADGRVRDVSVVSANPPGVFEDSARAAFRDARFAPAQRNGRPVRARVLIEVLYEWEGLD